MEELILVQEEEVAPAETAPAPKTNSSTSKAAAKDSEDILEIMSTEPSPARTRAGASRRNLGGLYSSMVQAKSGEVKFSSPTKGARQLADMLRGGSIRGDSGATSSMSLVAVMEKPALVEAPEVVRARERAVRAKKAQAEAIAAARLSKQAHAKKAAAAGAAGRTTAAGGPKATLPTATSHREPEPIRRITSKRSVPHVQPPAAQQLQLVLVDQSPPVKRQKRITRKETQVLSRPPLADAPGHDVD